MGVLKRYTIEDGKIISVTEIKPTEVESIEVKPKEAKRDKLQQTKQESKKKIYTKEMLQDMAKKVAEKLEKAKSNKA